MEQFADVVIFINTYFTKYFKLKLKVKINNDAPYGVLGL